MKSLFVIIIVCLAVASGQCQGFTLEEIDGSPRLIGPNVIRVSNGTLSCTGRVCVITTSGTAGLNDPGANGVVVRTALNTTTARTLTGTANRITITNGSGVSGNPTFDIGTDVVTLTGSQTLSNKILDNTNSFSGYFDAVRITAPSNPASGSLRLFANNTSGKLACLDNAGADCMPSGGGSIGGSAGTVDNALIRADGTGGATIQGSGSTATLTDTGALSIITTTNNVRPLQVNNSTSAVWVALDTQDVSGTGRARVVFESGAGDDQLRFTANTSGVNVFRLYEDSPTAEVTAAIASAIALRVNSATNSTDSLLVWNKNSNETNSVAEQTLSRMNSNGTAATGYGQSERWQLESSTTDNRDAASQSILWTDATDASRTAAIVLSTVNNAGSLTERIRFNFWGAQSSAVTFANLGSPSNGTSTYCSDCTVTSTSDNTCAGSGSGARAERLNSVWRCFTTQSTGSGGSANDYTAPPAVASFTWVNQGGATASDTTNTFVGAKKVPAISMAAPTSATDNLRILKKSAPATPYTITIAFQPLMQGQNYYAAGFVWRQSSDGKVINASFGFSTDYAASVDKWTDPTTYSANYVNFPVRHTSGPFWVKATDDGTNRVVSVSYDGENFIQIHSVGRTDFLTADEIGIYVNTNNTSFPMVASFVHWAQT